MTELGQRYTRPATLVLLGGSALCLLGSDRPTLDIDYVGDDLHKDDLQRAIELTAQELRIPVEAVPIARFVPVPEGADDLDGALRYPSDTGGWQLGDLDLSEYLDRYRNQKLVLIIALVGDVEPPTYTCGICGFVMNDVGECARCKLATEEELRDRERETRTLIDESEAFLAGGDGESNGEG